jgi:NAD(P)-dependent dehydrogenase (short-subunit alcohol dehydrogenase family)
MPSARPLDRERSAFHALSPRRHIAGRDRRGGRDLRRCRDPHQSRRRDVRDACARGNAGEVLRREMEVNVFGMLAMARVFAPLLARNGGGAIVNMLSVVSWYLPLQFDLRRDQACRPRRQGRARIQLKAQGTRVIGIYAGLIDPFVGQDVIETAENAFGGFLSDQLLDVFGPDESAAPISVAEELCRATRNTRDEVRLSRDVFLSLGVST